MELKWKRRKGYETYTCASNYAAQSCLKRKCRYYTCRKIFRPPRAIEGCVHPELPLSVVPSNCLFRRKKVQSERKEQRYPANPVNICGRNEWGRINLKRVWQRNWIRLDWRHSRRRLLRSDRCSYRNLRTSPLIHQKATEAEEDTVREGSPSIRDS